MFVAINFPPRDPHAATNCDSNSRLSSDRDSGRLSSLKKGFICGGFNIHGRGVVIFRDPIIPSWLTFFKIFFMQLIVLLWFSTLKCTAFRSSTSFEFCGTLDMVENGRRVVDNETGRGGWNFFGSKFLG